MNWHEAGSFAVNECMGRRFLGRFFFYVDLVTDLALEEARLWHTQKNFASLDILFRRLNASGLFSAPFLFERIKFTSLFKN